MKTDGILTSGESSSTKYLVMKTPPHLDGGSTLSGTVIGCCHAVENKLAWLVYFEGMPKSSSFWVNSCPGPPFKTNIAV